MDSQERKKRLEAAVRRMRMEKGVERAKEEAVKKSAVQGPDSETLGPRISKLDPEGYKQEITARTTDKPEIGWGGAEADLGTTSAEPILGVAESALSLGSGLLTWGAGKAFAVGPRLLGDTKSAENIEDIVNNLTYQPYSETGKEIVKGVSRGIETFLSPIHWYGQKIQESIIDPMKRGEGDVKATKGQIGAAESYKWFAELVGELAMFKGAHVFGKLPKHLSGRWKNARLAQAMGLKNYMGKPLDWYELDGSFREWTPSEDVPEIKIMEPTENLSGAEGVEGVSLEMERAMRDRKFILYDTLQGRHYNVGGVEARHYMSADPKVLGRKAMLEIHPDGSMTLVNKGNKAYKNKIQAVFGKQLGRPKTTPRANIDRPKLVHYDKMGPESRYYIQKGGDTLGEIRIRDRGDRTGELWSNEKDGLTDTERVNMMNAIRKQYPWVEQWDMTFDRAGQPTHTAQYKPDAFDYEPLQKQVNRAARKGLEIKNLIMERYGNIKIDEMESHVYTEGVKNRLPNISERQAIPFLIERKKISNFSERMDALVAEGKIHPEVAEVAKNPRTEVLREAEQIKEYYEDAHAFLAEHHDGIGFVENYVNRVWDLDKKGRRKMGNYFSTNNPNTKGRTIPSLVEGIENGYRPATLDVAELISIYDSYKIRTAYNAKFAKAIFELNDPVVGKLMNTINRVPKEFRDQFREMDHHELKKAVYRGGKPDLKEVEILRPTGPKGQLMPAGKELTLTTTPIIERANIWVHEDIYPFVNNIFGQRRTGTTIGYLEGVNQYLKKINLAASAFHHISLAEAGAGWGVGTKAFVETIKGMKEGKPYPISTPEMRIRAADALREGLTFDPLPDHHVHKVQAGLDRLARAAGTKNKIAGKAMQGFAKANRVWDSALWDYYHSTMKLLAYEKGVHFELKKLAESGDLMNMTSKDISKIKQEVAGFVNDSFGGQLWELSEYLGDPKIQQMLQLTFLSPDWTVSTLKQAGAFFKKGPAGRLGRRFWMRSAAIMFTMIQGLNYASSHKLYGEGRFTWDNPPGKKMYALLPYRGKDGEELYLRIGKQFREAPEMLVHPFEKIGGKMSPLLQITSEQFYGAAPGSGFPAEWKRKPHESEAKLRAKALAEKLTPFSARAFITGQPHSLLGSVPVSKGLTKWSAEEELVAALKDGKSGEELESLRKAILQNGLPYKEILKRAEATITKIENYKHRKIAKRIIRKAQRSNMGLFEVLEIEREKSGMTPEEWRSVLRQVRALRRELRSVRRQQGRYGIPEVNVPY